MSHLTRYLSALLRIACMALTFGIEYGLYVPIDTPLCICFFGLHQSNFNLSISLDPFNHANYTLPFQHTILLYINPLCNINNDY